MKVRLFGSYPGDRQWSMLYYGKALGEALAAQTASGVDLELVAPEVDDSEIGRWKTGWRRYISYPRLARREQGDVNHILDHGYAHLIKNLPPERTVITCHDLILCRFRDGTVPGSAGVLGAWLERQFRWMRDAAAVITPSRRTAQDLQAYLALPSEKIRVIPMGVNPDFRPGDALAARRVFKLPVDTRLLLHVGAGFGYKNFPAVLQTAQRLRAQGQNIHVVQAGMRWTAALQAEAAARGLAEAVHPFNTVDAETLTRLYQAADVFLFPSWWEGFGWPPLEAMASGLPVVASNRGSLPEVLGEAALFAAPDDIDAQVQQTLLLLTDARLADAQRQKGLRQARAYTWDKAAEATWSVYRNIR